MYNVWGPRLLIQLKKEKNSVSVGGLTLFGNRTLQPAWHISKYVILSDPHTGAKRLWEH